MKITNIRIILTVFIPVFLSGTPAFAKYGFNHGPYLQGLTESRVTVYFTTSQKGFSHVELRPVTGSAGITRHYTFIDGLAEAYNTMNAIALDSLLPDTEYEYRLVSKHIKTFNPYKIKYGDSTASPWYRFKTLNPQANSCSFFITGDIHGDAGKYSKLLSYLPAGEADIVFLLGDLFRYFQKPGEAYRSFIDTSVRSFAARIPFVAARGNHETRGAFAREYRNFVYLPDGHFYGLYTIGNTAVIVLDPGEDKPDSHPDYGGITAFDRYRSEQAEWLEKTVKSEKYQQAKHRIVLSHIPPFGSSFLTYGEDYAGMQVSRLFIPLLNSAGVDLMISGHTHRHFILEEKEGINNFPILVNDNQSASFITVDNDGIHVKTVNTKGKITLERTF
jgi:predicted phosphodiesterase